MVVLVGTSPAQITRSTTPFQQGDSVPTLSDDESMAIITAALDFQHRHRRKPDCSHLVHAIYVTAGFRYPYTKSLDLYKGAADGFVQVTAPHSGDLIVWPRHVGIVVNPVQHSFYSSLRSGLGIDYYDAPYWEHKGVPRFYRFPANSVVKLQPRTEPFRIDEGDEYNCKRALIDEPR